MRAVNVILSAVFLALALRYANNGDVARTLLSLFFLYWCFSEIRDNVFERLRDENRRLRNCDNCKHRLVKARGDIMELDEEDYGEPCCLCEELDKWENGRKKDD